LKILSLDRLTEFSKLHADAGDALMAWKRTTDTATWRSLMEVRKTYAHADGVKLASGRATTRSRPLVADDYLKLIREFPLKPIRSAKEHRIAQAILDRLVGRENLSRGQRDYLEGLVRFVQDYEHEQAHAQLKNLPPLDLLKHLLEENHLTTSDLGEILGSRGLASEVLNGKRGLSKALISKLAHRFGVEPSLFFETGS
jgi:HTH-type transcriptional regulator/antitoxin HigA